MWIYIGEVYIPFRSMFPCAINTSTRVVSFDESRERGFELASTVKPVTFVTDGASIYHPLYTEIPTSSGVVPAEELVAKSRVVEGGVCSVLRSVVPYTIVFGDKRSSEQYSVYPVIVVYKNRVWEHLSLAPVKVVETGTGRVNDEYGIGIVEVQRDAEVVRPYARSMLMNPTMSLLSKMCNIASTTDKSRIKRKLG